MNNQQPSLFISYAREDIEMVEKIYDDFLSSGVAPWLDLEEILPGDNWKLKIKEQYQQMQLEYQQLVSQPSLSLETH